MEEEEEKITDFNGTPFFLLSALVACSAHLASGGKRREKGKNSSSNRFHVAMGRLKVKIVVVGSPRGKYGQNAEKNYKFPLSAFGFEAN